MFGLCFVEDSIEDSLLVNPPKKERTIEVVVNIGCSCRTLTTGVAAFRVRGLAARRPPGDAFSTSPGQGQRQRQDGAAATWRHRSWCSFVRKQRSLQNKTGET